MSGGGRPGHLCNEQREMEIKKTIRIILADDHEQVRRGIRRILEKASNLLVVGEAGTGAGALQLVHELEPDVLLLDMEMPDMTGTQVARELRRNHVPVSIVVLSACDDEHFIEETLRVGVDGYLAKSEPPARIRQVIYQVTERNAVCVPLLLLLLPTLGLSLFQALNNTLPGATCF